MLAHELLAELRRDLTEDRQTDVAPQHLQQLAPADRVVCTHHDQSGYVGPAGQLASTQRRRRGRGAALAGVQHQHQRRVHADRIVDGTRAVHALPAIQRRAGGHHLAQLGIAGKLGRDGLRVQGRIDDARCLTGAVIEQAPQREVESEEDRARGATLPDGGQQSAGGKVDCRARLEAGEDETGNGHAAPGCGEGRASPPSCEEMSCLGEEYKARGRHCAPMVKEVRLSVENVIRAVVSLEDGRLLG